MIPESCYIGLPLRQDKRHFPPSIPYARGAGMVTPIPYAVARKLPYSVENIQYRIETREGGVLVLWPEPRPQKWAISSDSDQQ